MTEDEVLERILVTYQTYDAFGEATYRTAVVWARPDHMVVEDFSAAFWSGLSPPIRAGPWAS